MEQTYIKRETYLQKLIDRMDNGEVKIVTGPRRCGKSWLLKRIFKDYLVSNGVAEESIIIVSFDMDDEELAEFQLFAKQVAVALKKAFPCKKVAQVVLGLEVPHAHIHLIPMNSEGDVDFRKEKLHLPNEEMQQIADKIFAAFKG